MKNEIRDNIEVRFHEDGTIDEIVTMHNGRCSFHMEQMDDNYFWMRFYGVTQDLVVNMDAHKDEISVTYEWEPGGRMIDRHGVPETQEGPKKQEREIAVGNLINRYGTHLVLQAIADIYKRGEQVEHKLKLIEDLEAIQGRFIEGDNKYWDEILAKWKEEIAKNDLGET